MNQTIKRRFTLMPMAMALFCLLVVFDWQVCAQVASPAPSASPSPTLCKDGVSPGVIQLTPDPANPSKLALARKHFYLSSSPFNLTTTVNLKTAPSLRSYYKSAVASQQLIDWLEDNHCETIYCRELTDAEVKCAGGDPQKCVPEFIAAYRNALTKLNGNQELARKWITNYEPLSSPSLRVGFYDLCPGMYYISTIAPLDNAGIDVFWETSKPIKVEGPPDVNKAIVVTLAFPPGNDKKNFFVGRL